MENKQNKPEERETKRKESDNKSSDKKIQSSEEINNLYYQYQNLTTTVEQLNQQVEYLKSELDNLKYFKSGLNELTSKDDNNETLIPIANGIFMKAKISNTKDFYVNVGASTIVKKTKEQTISYLNKKIEELRDNLNILNLNIQRYYQQINAIATEINNLQRGNN